MNQPLTASVKWFSAIALSLLVGFGGARVAKHGHSSSAHPPITLQVGDKFPGGTAFGDAHQPVKLLDVVAAHPRTLLVVFSIGCTKCLGEAEQWKQISKDLNAHLVAVAYTAKWDAVEEFKKMSQIRDDVYLCDNLLRDQLQSTSSPLIMVIEKNTIQFRGDGPQSTVAVEKWATSTAAETQ